MVAQLDGGVFRNKTAPNAEILNWRTLLAFIKRRYPGHTRAANADLPEQSVYMRETCISPFTVKLSCPSAIGQLLGNPRRARRRGKMSSLTKAWRQSGFRRR
jgi:hypothetical protein